MHGYNLIKEFKRITGRRLKPAVIYPFLHTLEEKGYVVGTWMSRGKRRIKSYSVTQKGRMLLATVREHFQLPFKEIILDLLSRDRKKEKRIENVTETGEVILVSTLLKIVQESGYFKVKQIRDFMAKQYYDEQKWLNTRWIGRALGRLGFREKRRLGSGVEYKLTPEKQFLTVYYGVCKMNC